jgi:uncharacterized membrane protein
MDTGKSALGLDGNLAAALGYPIGIIAIISLIIEKENRFVRFHALQSVLLFVLWIVVVIVLSIVSVVLGLIIGAAANAAGGAGGIISVIFSLISLLVWLVLPLLLLAILIFAAVKAYGGNLQMQSLETWPVLWWGRDLDSSGIRGHPPVGVRRRQTRAQKH